MCWFPKFRVTLGSTMTVVARQSTHASSPDVNAEAVAATRYSMEGRDKGRERRQALISRVIRDAAQ